MYIYVYVCVNLIFLSASFVFLCLSVRCLISCTSCFVQHFDMYITLCIIVIYIAVKVLMYTNKSHSSRYRGEVNHIHILEIVYSSIDEYSL